MGVMTDIVQNSRVLEIEKKFVDIKSSYQAHGRASCALAIWAGGCGAGVETGCQDGSDGRPLVCKTGKYSSDQCELERAGIHSLCFEGVNEDNCGGQVGAT